MSEVNYDLTYLSLGAGVQSSALLVCSALGLHGVPRADVAIFADTQQEPAYVYRHLDALRAWSATRGLVVETVTRGDLFAEGRARSLIPAFTMGTDGRAAPLPRRCTSDYKVEPLLKRARELLGRTRRPMGELRARCLLGISLDEVERMKSSPQMWVTNCYPLVDARLTRGDCLRIMEENGLPRPEKSACVFCPYHSDAAWARLRREHPADFARAVKADEEIREPAGKGRTELAYLHRSLRPLREIDFEAELRSKTPLFDGFANECEGMCGV